MTSSVNAQQPQTVQVPNYSGVNIQIFNPSVNAGGNCPTVTPPIVQQQPQQAPQTTCCYPSNYYTTNLCPPQAQQAPQTPQTEVKTDKPDKKTEKRQITELTDDYLKTVETYLNNQNAEIRILGAKEVFARLQEDESRKEDPALNALVNKMLQDPSQPVKFLAMAALESRLAAGDDLTVNLLKGIQQQKTGYGQDAIKASNILMKMSGKQVEKEFEVKDNPKKSEKTDNNNSKTEKK